MYLFTAMLFTTLFDPVQPCTDRDECRGFCDRVHKDAEGKEYKYVVFVPHDYHPDKQWPVILYLHGAGERGEDGRAPAVGEGLGPAIRKREQTFPFIVVFPQCSPGGTWRAGTPDAKRAMEILAEVEENFKTDPNRVYGTGQSLGGMGTWSLAMRYPDRFAALVPVCGRGDSSQASKIAQIPVWCFHGDRDRLVPVEGSRAMVAALKAAGGDPKYTEYAGAGHNIWTQAYDTDDLYTWLAQQTRAREDL